MCRRKKDSPKGRGVGEAEDWSGVLARSAKSMGAKRPALPKKWGPRNTRKDAKGDERCGPGDACHIARPDLERGRDALLRDPAWHVQKTCHGNI